MYPHHAKYIHRRDSAAVPVPTFSRCVLLHGLFEVWGHGRSQDEAAADAVRWVPGADVRNMRGTAVCMIATDG